MPLRLRTTTTPVEHPEPAAAPPVEVWPAGDTGYRLRQAGIPVDQLTVSSSPWWVPGPLRGHYPGRVDVAAVAGTIAGYRPPAAPHSGSRDLREPDQASLLLLAEARRLGWPDAPATGHAPRLRAPWAAWCVHAWLIRAARAEAAKAEQQAATRRAEAARQAATHTCAVCGRLDPATVTTPRIPHAPATAPMCPACADAVRAELAHPHRDLARAWLATHTPTPTR